MTREIPAPRFLNRPLALLPSYRSLVLYPDDSGSRASKTEQGDGLVGGIAVIGITGCLVHGAGYGFGWGETPYSAIRSAFAAALDDPDVTAIALHIDSPGGEVAGCADLADAIFQARGIKPVHAIVDEMAASAAYWLASAADRIVTPRTGLVGSVGVVTFHTDMTRALDAAGIKITTVQYGANKTDSYPTTPMTNAARQRAQADVDNLGDLFTQTVARNRGIRARDVRGFEAGTFLGRDAVRAGLADAVMSPDEAFLELMDAATERPAARSSARAAQLRDTPKVSKKKVPTMAAAKDFSHLRAASQQPAPATSTPKPRTLGERHRALLRAKGETIAEPVDALPEQPLRRKGATSTLGERVAKLHKRIGR